VPDGDGPGEDLAAQELEHFLRREPLLRQGLCHEPAADLVGNDAVDRLCGQRAQVLAQHRDGARAKAVEVLAVLGKGMHGER